MSIASFVYKKIIEKLNLSKKELLTLKKKMNKENICYGPLFSRKTKMCPTTTAISIKTKIKKFTNNEQVWKQIRKHNIPRIYFKFLYLIFDIPSKFSKRYFEAQLNSFKDEINELLRSKTLNDYQ